MVKLNNVQIENISKFISENDHVLGQEKMVLTDVLIAILDDITKKGSMVQKIQELLGSNTDRIKVKKIDNEIGIGISLDVHKDLIQDEKCCSNEIPKDILELLSIMFG